MEKGSLRSKKERIRSILSEPLRLGMAKHSEAESSGVQSHTQALSQASLQSPTPRRGQQSLGVGITDLADLDFDSKSNWSQMLSMWLSSTEVKECLSASACGLNVERWTKNAKSDFVRSGIDDPNDTQKSIKFRLGVLNAEFCRMMDIACKNSGLFADAMNDVASTISKLQLHGEDDFKKNLDEDFIDEPLVVKSKGAPKRNTKFKQRRRCSNCGVIGHYNRSCPNYDGVNRGDSLAADGKAKSSHPSSATFMRRKRKVSYLEYEDSDELWDKEVDTKGGRKKR
ncbi:hypothetical protein PIB30_087413 [Stylosanthes scabra]|uniref:CCHC-type domain-containing protein n=1 Tax=Stylosanthes scabra TaxID=79078 RepID=A0ABU6XST1_9FABA|nr:hypothetical protein [Stylosanthes scabra]